MQSIIWFVHRDNEVKSCYRETVLKQTKQKKKALAVTSRLGTNYLVSNMSNADIGRAIFRGENIGTFYYGLNSIGRKKAWKIIGEDVSYNYNTLVGKLNTELLEG